MHWGIVGSHDDLRDDFAVAEMRVYARFCVLGDKLLAPRCFNDALHEFCHRFRESYLDPLEVEYIYANTTAGSKLRKYTPDAVFHNINFFGDGDEWRDFVSSEGGDFTTDLALNSLACSRI